MNLTKSDAVNLVCSMVLSTLVLLILTKFIPQLTPVWAALSSNTTV